MDPVTDTALADLHLQKVISQDTGVPAYNLSIEEAEAEGSQVRGQPTLCSQLKEGQLSKTFHPGRKERQEREGKDG